MLKESVMFYCRKSTMLECNSMHRPIRLMSMLFLVLRSAQNYPYWL